MYRPNVAGIFAKTDGTILICQRTDNPATWQFPQGGVDQGESAITAFMREAQEEVGLTPDQYHILQTRGPYRYDYPPEVYASIAEKRGEPFIGQEQTYFLCQLNNASTTPLLDQHEFQAYQWIQPEQFPIRSLTPFKQDTYRAVLRDFFGITL